MSILVAQLSSEDNSQWDQYVLDHPLGSPFHLLAWKTSIENTFSYRAIYLCAREQGRITGVLPLFLVDNFVLGKALISSPFAVYGGIIANSKASSIALYDHARALGAELGVEYVEYRNAFAEQCSQTPNVDRYSTFSRTVTADEKLLMEGLPKKTRNLVRKSLKSGCQMVYGCQDSAEFERIYSQNMRRLGTPSFPRKHFAQILRHFGSMVDIREVRFEGRTVAASMNFFFRDQMHTYYAASDPAFNHLAPNMFMYYDHLRWCGENGLKTFDFGRCKKGSGVYDFKSQWGSDVRELPYEIVLVKRKDLPNFTPTNQKFDLGIRVWQKLPLPITRTLGPHIVKLFP